MKNPKQPWLGENENISISGFSIFASKELIKNPWMFWAKIKKQNGTSPNSSAFNIKNNAPKNALPTSIIMGKMLKVYLSVRIA